LNISKFEIIFENNFYNCAHLIVCGFFSLNHDLIFLKFDYF